MRTFNVTVNGKAYEVEIEEIGGDPVVAPVAPVARPASPSPRKAAAPKPAAAPAPETGDGSIVAPMPGTVLSLNCDEGKVVKKGDVLLVLEAMKMENEIQAPADGTVATVKVSKGQSVDAGEVLVQLAD